MGRGSHGKIASTAAIEVYTEEHKKLKHKLCFLPLERLLFQCARFSFLDAHSSL